MFYQRVTNLFTPHSEMLGVIYPNHKGWSQKISRFNSIQEFLPDAIIKTALRQIVRSLRFLFTAPLFKMAVECIKKVVTLGLQVKLFSSLSGFSGTSDLHLKKYLSFHR